MITTSASRVISTLRLPLIIGVVFIHSKIPSPLDTPALTNTMTIFSEILPKFCVPLFFVFSGYLFFGTTDAFTAKDYQHKLKSRFRSLFVPYIVWNTLVILFYYCVHRFMPSMINPIDNNIADMSAIELLKSFWDHSGGFPIAYQFWFIRDLMVVMLLSPIVYLVVRRTIIGIIVLIVLYFILPHFSAAYFFSLGAYFALQNKDFIALSKRVCWYAVPICIISLIATMMFKDIEYITKIYILSSMIVVLTLTDAYSSKHQLPALFSNLSFFIFCYHILPLLIVQKIGKLFLENKSEILWIIDYFANPVIIVALGILLYKLLSLYTPRLLSFITGGR